MLLITSCTGCSIQLFIKNNAEKLLQCIRIMSTLFSGLEHKYYSYQNERNNLVEITKGDDFESEG